jgi:hypothetical protein
MTTFSETALPALVFTVPAGHPTGTASALGTLTITELQNADQQQVIWGAETDDLYDITATTAALFYEAELMTTTNGTAVATVSGSSGAGTNNVLESIALPPTPIAMMRTEVGVGKLTHVGEFRVIARVMNTSATGGSVNVRLDWGVGDLATYTSNATTTLSSTVAGTFRLVDLGLVRIPPAPITGVAQRWDGKVMASSTAGDKLRVDCIMLFPTMLSGQSVATSQPPVGTTLTEFDSFDQTAGNLTGKISPLLGTAWALFMSSSSGTDFAVDATNHIITRSAQDPLVNNGRDGRGVTLSTTAYGQATASVDINWASVAVPPAGSAWTGTGILFRCVSVPSLTGRLEFASLNIGGSYNLLRYTIGGTQGATGNVLPAPSAGVWYTLTVTVDTSGRLRAWWNPRGAALGGPYIDMTDSRLATGGSMATGMFGIYDANASGTTFTRSLDNFTLYAPGSSTPPDAALFRSRSMQITHERAHRQDFSNSRYQPLTNYEGDYLRIPARTREQRQIRFIVKASRSIIGNGEDAGIDDIQATLSYAPRYLSVPVAT